MPPQATTPALPYYQLFLSMRYLRARVSALTALLSVGFGVAIIVIVRSIMGGYVVELREMIRGQESHLMILGRQPFPITRVVRLQHLIERVDNVAATAPFVETLGLYRSVKFSPCQVKGILPSRQARVSDIEECVLRPGELEAVLADLGLDRPSASQARDTGRPAATRIVNGILGDTERRPVTAARLQELFEEPHRRTVLERYNPAIIPDLQGDVPPTCLVGIHMLLDRQVFLGQILTIVSVKPWTSEPVSRKLVVAGAFKTGEYTTDSGVVFVHVDVLKNMLDLFDVEANSYRYEGFRVALEDPDRLEETRARLQMTLMASPYPEYRNLVVYTWEQLRKPLLTAVEREKLVIYILLVLLVGFTACMVFLMVLLMVIEKTRDLGVLMALGATPLGIVRLFLTNSLILYVAGTGLGLALGYLFCAYINPIHDWIEALTGLRLFPAEIYHMDRIPVAYQPWDVLRSIGIPIGLAFLASLTPALWAVRRHPIKAIQHE